MIASKANIVASFLIEKGFEGLAERLISTYVEIDDRPISEQDIEAEMKYVLHFIPTAQH